jgi:hypothetical protein
MSTRVTQPKPVSGSNNRGLGLAAAGLAIVVALGIGLDLSEDNVGSHSDVQPAHPQVSDSRRVKAEIITERDSVSPGANVEGYKVGAGIVGVETPETFNIEEHRIEMQAAWAEWDALARRAQAYTGMQEQAQKTGGEVAGN